MQTLVWVVVLLHFDVWPEGLHRVGQSEENAELLHWKYHWLWLALLPRAEVKIGGSEGDSEV